MPPIAKKINDFFIGRLWDKDISSLSSLEAIPIRILRLLYTAVRGLTEEELSLRAMSLVYTTLLSLVPLLAVSFSVLKAFGVHTRLEIFLYYFLEPLGPKGVDISMQVIEFVENIKVGVLGSIGLSILFYTVVSLIQKIERALNSMWNVKGTRSFARRFSNYLSVLLIGPVLVFSAAGISASLMSTTIVQKLFTIEPFGTILLCAGKLLPYILLCAAFTVIYIYLPNTKVHFGSALVGGIFASVLLKTTGWAFASFIVSSTKYSAIYSGFAILILFMLWLYLNWFILLVGARISFYHQYPHFLYLSQMRVSPGNRLKERLAVQIMFLVGHSFYHNRDHLTFELLEERLGLPAEAIHGVLNLLLEQGLIAASGDESPVYFPARDIETISLKEVLDAVRHVRDDNFAYSGMAQSIPGVEDLMNRIDDAISGSLEKETVKSLVLSEKR